MPTLDDDSLQKYLREHPPQGFKPIPMFNRRGQLIVWYWSDDEGYADPIHHNGILIGHLIRSHKTKEVVGVKICAEAITGLSINTEEKKCVT